LRYVLALVAFGVIGGGAFLLAFPARDLLFNVGVIPMHTPWTGQSPFNLVRVALELQQHAFLPAVVLAFAGLYRLVAPTDRPQGAPGAPSSGAWTVFLVVGLLNVPTAILGRVKEGGDLNAFSPALYFLAIALCLLLRDQATVEGGPVPF